jgi:ubiquinone/menaquinone biosynthesis C-methylase UbiE
MYVSKANDGRVGKDGLHRFYEDREVAEKYVSARFASELNQLLHDRQVSTINRLTEAVRPQRMLEIATGPGRITRDARPSGTFVCLEYNEVMIALGRAACQQKIGWVCGDGFHLPFAQVFDLVYSFRFIRHFQREDRNRLYAALRRVIKPRGYFVMDAVNEKVSRPLRENHPSDYPIYDKLYRREELRNELFEAGLETVKMLPVQKYYRWQYRSQVLLGPRATWANRLLIRALERLPRSDGLEWIVTCRRA